MIAAATDSEAHARFDHIVAGADEEAIANIVGQAELDRSEGMSESPERKTMFMGLPSLVGSHATVAAYLDRIALEAEVTACMFVFPHLEADLDRLASEVMPRMPCRQGHAA